MKPIRASLPFALAAAALFVAGGIAQQSQPEPDYAHMNQQEKRQRNMELFTPEQSAHMQRNSAIDRQQWMKDHPARQSTGMIALTDLGKGTYKGEQGGLYPGGVNTPPPAHLAAGETLARKIVPRDAEGRPSKSGKIVLISIGMSNTTMKFQVFQKIAAEDKALNPSLAIVDGAQGAQTGWVTSHPDMPFWGVLDSRLKSAGVTRNQVQAAWILQADPGPYRPFPVAAKDLEQNLVDTLHIMHDRFPNLKIAYLSSRTYGGYALTWLNPEPFAYESGFTVKWLIADQIAGKPELNCDPAKGAVRAPWLAWGPYLWADGVKPNKDGLSYAVDDYVAEDRTHPSDSGRMKVATRLLAFLKTDSTARPWFTKSGRE